MTAEPTNPSAPEVEQDDAEIEVFSFAPERSQKNMRLDKYVAGELTNLSRTYLQQLIDDGHVLVDGISRRAAFKITPGQVVSVAIPETVETELQAENLPLNIIYDDEDVVVINKPPGFVVHPAPGHPGGTVVNALIFHYPEISVGGLNRPGIVHRLDKDTSGVMIIAKSDRAHASLVQQWQDRQVGKHYTALVARVIEEDEATIDAPIGRDPANRLRMAAVRSGKDAVTHFDVVERYKDATLLNVRIDTGRTHQIRVHLAMIGHPVIGDHLYASNKSRQVTSTLESKRQFLHATRLELKLPGDRHTVFEAPLADDLVAIINGLEAAE